MNIHLKVKICTLAAEAKVIRQQEQRLTRFNKLDEDVYQAWRKTRHLKQDDADLKVTTAELRIKKRLLKARIAKVKQGNVWPTLHHHRRGVVRYEARHNLLAYGFLRGLNYVQLEKKCYTKPDFDKVLRIAKRFDQSPDERDINQKFEEWVQNGKRDQDRLQSTEGKVAAE